jgi:hypothetical protein
MKLSLRFTLALFTLFAFFLPSFASAQNTARIECPRNDGYVYLYSSVVSLDVRGTLQCGEIVQVIGRDETYLAVRTAKGESGFVPMASAAILKNHAASVAPAQTAPARERIAYDSAAAPVPAPTKTPLSGFVLSNKTPIRLKLLKTLSSATARVNDPVELEVLDPVVVDSVTVISKGSKVTAVVAVSESKRRFGHNGRIAFNVTSVQLANNQQAPVRCYQEASGAPSTSSDSVVAFSSGKDASLLADTTYTALVDGDLPLDRVSFTASPSDSPSPSATTIPPSSH